MNTINQYKDKDINFIEVSHDNFKVVLCDWAASLYQIWFNNELMTTQVKDPNDFKSPWEWFGKTIGRFAGRIPQGKITIDNKQYVLPTNEMGNTLHGGSDGLSNQVFNLLSIDNNDDKTIVNYQYISKDGQAGFVGNLTLDVIYEIPSNKNEVKIIFKAICDKKSPINITNHVFFNLGDQSIDHLHLKINANKFVYPRALDLLPIEDRPVVKCLDFNRLKPLIRDINDPEINYGRSRGYDHFMIFNEINPNVAQVQLQNDRYHLDVYTDYSGVVIYSENFTSPHLCIGCDKFYHRGLAIEAQCSPLHDNLIPANTKIEHFVKFVIRKK